MPSRAIQATIDEYIRNIALDDEVSLAAMYSQTAGDAVASQVEAGALRAVGISQHAFRLMFLLRIIGAAEPAEISSAMFLSPPVIHELLARLRADGFVQPDRGVFARLSADGERLTQELLAAIQQEQARALSAFTREELRTYLGLSQKLVAAARARAASSAP